MTSFRLVPLLPWDFLVSTDSGSLGRRWIRLRGKNNDTQHAERFKQSEAFASTHDDDALFINAEICFSLFFFFFTGEIKGVLQNLRVNSCRRTTRHDFFINDFVCTRLKICVKCLCFVMSPVLSRGTATHSGDGREIGDYQDACL